MRISDWSSDVCSSDLDGADRGDEQADEAGEQPEAYIVGQCGRIAPDLDRPDRRAVAAHGQPERAREEDSGQYRRRVRRWGPPFGQRPSAIVEHAEPLDDGGAR